MDKKAGDEFELIKGVLHVRRATQTIGHYDLEGTIDEAIEYLGDLWIPEGFTHLALKWEYSRDYEDDALLVVAYREATQEERKEYDDQCKVEHDKSLEFQRKQYEELKKLFE